MQYQKNLPCATARPVCCAMLGADDAEQVLRIFNLTHAQTEFLLTYPGKAR